MSSSLASFFPKQRIVTNITQANPAVVTTSVPHLYQPGLSVRIVIPYPKSMPQINGFLGFITILSPTTFSMPIDSTNFTAFALDVNQPPTMTPKQNAQSVPVSELNKTLVNAVDNKGPRNP